MKITKTKLKQIIREEVEFVLKETDITKMDPLHLEKVVMQMAKGKRDRTADKVFNYFEQVMTPAELETFEILLGDMEEDYRIVMDDRAPPSEDSDNDEREAKQRWKHNLRKIRTMLGKYGLKFGNQ